MGAQQEAQARQEQALAAVVGEITAKLDALAAAYTAPKRIIKDASGKPVGVAPVNMKENVNGSI